MPVRATHTDHTELLPGPYATGSDVTRACLSCHEESGEQMLHSSHWTWLSEPQAVGDDYLSIGKANLLNNFCIGVQSNWTGCTRCHNGYGWTDANFDFTNQENIDCLSCHDQSGTYVKGGGGLPVETVDLAVAAQSVGTPSRETCGFCHFDGGGGNGVKHGDLDESLYYPAEQVDVHMGGNDFLCVDCHRTTDHEIAGRAISVNFDTTENQVQCTDCHDSALHDDDRIADHLDTLACQTCHVPAVALRDPTKISWDWSTAGLDLPENIHEYLRIKGTFVYTYNLIPTYGWFNGSVDRYLLGDEIDPTTATIINQPLGDISDPNALIYPFKVHTGFQVYDAEYNYFLQPQTTGETGYWTTFDWNSALENGSAATGLPYSGSYDFAPTEMYWTLSHMVAPASNALQCADCHEDTGRFDWEALGYVGDPMEWGGR
ncbi:MAG: tetrathionate reductase family octaheme c-type cytochrome [Anaerolinea sp.]|nr:tetrathionate reductase family octaheme c-type cytochrome [Anaerolinea sp.]